MAGWLADWLTDKRTWKVWHPIHYCSKSDEELSWGQQHCATTWSIIKNSNRLQMMMMLFCVSSCPSAVAISRILVALMGRHWSPSQMTLLFLLLLLLLLLTLLCSVSSKGEWAVERGRQHFDRRRQQIDLTPAECKNDSVERSRERERESLQLGKSGALPKTWAQSKQSFRVSMCCQHNEQQSWTVGCCGCCTVRHSADVGN